MDRSADRDNLRSRYREVVERRRQDLSDVDEEASGEEEEGDWVRPFLGIGVDRDNLRVIYGAVQPVVTQLNVMCDLSGATVKREADIMPSRVDVVENLRGHRAREVTPYDLYMIVRQHNEAVGRLLGRAPSSFGLDDIPLDDMRTASGVSDALRSAAVALRTFAATDDAATGVARQLGIRRDEDLRGDGHDESALADHEELVHELFTLAVGKTCA